MTKKEFIELFAKNAELSKKSEAERLVNAFLASVEESLINQDGVTFMGFGKFECTKREERKCINPQTRKEMTVPAKMVVKFKAGKTLGEKVNVVKKTKKPAKKK